MLIAVRPPEYAADDKVWKFDKEEDHERSPEALYWSLVVYHLLFAVSSFWEAFIKASTYRYTPAIFIVAIVTFLI